MTEDTRRAKQETVERLDEAAKLLKEYKEIIASSMSKRAATREALDKLDREIEQLKKKRR